MSEENVAMIRQAYADFNAGSPEKVVAIMDPEVEWTEPDVGGNAPSGTFTSPESVGNDVFGKIGGAFDEFSANPDEFKDEGDTVVVTGHFKGKSKSGNELDAGFEMTFEITDGKIAKFEHKSLDPESLAAAWS